MKLFDIEKLSSLRGNMARCCDHARAGKQKFKPSRAEVVAEKRKNEKAENRAFAMKRIHDQMKRIHDQLFPQPKFNRVAAVIQTGTHNFRVLAGLQSTTHKNACMIPATAEITRGELNIALRSRGFDGLRFAKTRNFAGGKRVLSLF